MKNNFEFGACETCAIYNKYRDPLSHVGGRSLWLTYLMHIYICESISAKSI